MDQPLAVMTGMNEMGLSFDINWIPPEKLTPHPERDSPDGFENPLGEISTVEEVISKLHAYNLGDSISAQIHYADKSGDAAVIYPGPDSELTYC